MAEQQQFIDYLGSPDQTNLTDSLMKIFAHLYADPKKSSEVQA